MFECAHRQIFTISPFLALHHGTMNIRNNCVGVCNIVLELGNDGVCIHDVMLNVGNGGVDIQNVTADVGNDGVGS